MRIRSLVALLLLAGALASVGSKPVSGQTPASPLFDDQVLHEVRLFINSRDLNVLREQYDKNFYFPADFIWQGQRVRNVGVRSRGLGSRNPVKLGLNVEFDHYTTGQEFLGLRSLVLDNLWQDPSLIREVLAMAAFRRMGQAAPLESFAKVFINNEYQGVYAIVEPVDSRFVASTFAELNGRLFEYRWLMPFYMEDLGDDLAIYQQLFESRSPTADTEAMLYQPIRDLFRVINEPDDGQWRERIEERIDLRQFLAHVAIQGVVADNDGIMGYAGLNNFYLYRFAGSNRHRVLPWDADFAFAFDASVSILRRGEQPVVLFERAYAYEDLRTFYLDFVEDTARKLDEEGWLGNEIERLVALIGPAAFQDQKKQYSNEAFVADADFLRAFAAARRTNVETEVASLRAVAR